MSDNAARLTAALASVYRIDHPLGAGGTATVFSAHDLKHKRRVAIKVLHEDLAASVGAARFLREIEIAAQLQHPNILPLLDSGEADGLLYYVMPLVEGSSLRERLTREGRLPVAEAIRLLLEIIDALGYAHKRGVVHRDVKPDNIMLSGRHALVADFGIARAISQGADGHQITSVGIALGTPAYMAPEQALGDPATDHCADIYAVGVLAYEMLSGRPPFHGVSPQRVLASHLNERPTTLSIHRTETAGALESVIMRCLEKDPADRWRSADELLAALEPLAVSSGANATPRGVNRIGTRRRTATLLGALIAIVAVATAVSFLARAKPAAHAAIGSLTPFTTDAGLEIEPTITQDGKYVAYALGTVSRMRVFVSTLR